MLSYYETPPRITAQPVTLLRGEQNALATDDFQFNPSTYAV
jgi:hypothetical protein